MPFQINCLFIFHFAILLSGSGLVEGKEYFTHNEGLLTGELPLEENNSYISSSPLKFERKTSIDNLNHRHFQNTTSSVKISENNDVSSMNLFATDKISQIIHVAVAVVLRILIETNDSYFFVNVSTYSVLCVLITCFI